MPNITIYYAVKVTERLYYSDSYLQTFEARVLETSEDGCRVYLDRTAFYPTSGGQLFDLGTLGGVPVVEVIDEDDRVAHVLAQPVSGAVTGCIDWTRRYDFMQQHTGQHLLSAVLEELFGMQTVSVHMGADSNTIDVNAASVTEAQLAQAEQRCTEIIAQARPVAVTFEDSSTIEGLRKESSRTGTLRIVSIGDCDRSACGGTHVRSTAEIGLVLAGKTEKLRGITRIEFACGTRALRRARADNQLLASIARTLSIAADQVPERLTSLLDHNKSLEKERLKLATELAGREGHDLYFNATVDGSGLRRVIVHGPIDEAVRVRAQAFAANEQAVFLAVSKNPPAILLATSADSGVHAGERVKAALAQVGGRGGGNQALAQGSVPDGAVLEKVIALLQ